MQLEIGTSNEAIDSNISKLMKECLSKDLALTIVQGHIAAN